jgi:hypothetical protein
LVTVDGWSVIADAATGELLVVDRAGQWHLVATRGQGPHDVGVVTGIMAGPSGGVYVADAGNGRIARLDLSSLRLEVSARTAGPVAPLPHGFGPSGQEFIDTYATYSAYFTEAWKTLPIVLWDMTSGLREEIRGYERAPALPADWQFGEVVPFRPTGLLRTSAESILVSRTDRPEVLGISPTSGGVVVAVRWPESHRTPTTADWERELARAESEEAKIRSRRHFTGHLPEISALFGDSAGRIWIGEYTPGLESPTRYGVFHPDGLRFGSATLPPGTRILNISEDAILAVRVSPNGEPHVILLPYNLAGG